MSPWLCGHRIAGKIDESVLYCLCPLVRGWGWVFLEADAKRNDKRIEARSGSFEPIFLARTKGYAVGGYVLKESKVSRDLNMS